jgi:hypothetical protein
MCSSCIQRTLQPEMMHLICAHYLEQKKFVTWLAVAVLRAEALLFSSLHSACLFIPKSDWVEEDCVE